MHIPEDGELPLPPPRSLRIWRKSNSRLYTHGMQRDMASILHMVPNRSLFFLASDSLTTVLLKALLFSVKVTLGITSSRVDRLFSRATRFL